MNRNGITFQILRKGGSSISEVKFFGISPEYAMKAAVSDHGYALGSLIDIQLASSPQRMENE